MARKSSSNAQAEQKDPYSKVRVDHFTCDKCGEEHFAHDSGVVAQCPQDKQRPSWEVNRVASVESASKSASSVEEVAKESKEASA